MNKFLIVAAIVALVILSGCAKDQINRALFSIGEQVSCNERSENLLNREKYRTSCLAEVETNSEFDRYSKSREEYIQQ
ncbi:MAG: hypothetical protein AAF387_20715 [Pseudomonadota bacterium]